MNTKFWGSFAGATLAGLVCTMPLHAETRTEWGTGPITGAIPMDDEALMQVSAQGIDEHAVKALQNNGKLADYAAGAGVSHALLGKTATESAEKQAIQNQIRMALGSTQTVVNTTQITGVVASMAAPVSFVPVMSMPLFGLPLLPPKASNEK
ncbi:MAG: hypothetical protein ACM3VZ_06855 [Acidobacteriota bacterium]